MRLLTCQLESRLDDQHHVVNIGLYVKADNRSATTTYTTGEVPVLLVRLVAAFVDLAGGTEAIPIQLYGNQSHYKELPVLRFSIDATQLSKSNP